MDWQEVNRNRTLRATAVFLVLITPMFLAAPVLTLLWLGWNWRCDRGGTSHDRALPEADG